MFLFCFIGHIGVWTQSKHLPLEPLPEPKFTSIALFLQTSLYMLTGLSLGISPYYFCLRQLLDFAYLASAHSSSVKLAVKVRQAFKCLLKKLGRLYWPSYLSLWTDSAWEKYIPFWKPLSITSDNFMSLLLLSKWLQTPCPSEFSNLP